MSILGFLLLLLLGGVIGAVAGMLIGYSPGGFLASIVVGLLGAVLGSWIAGAVGLPTIFAVNIEGKGIDIVWAIIGSVVLLFILGVLRRGMYSAGTRRRYL